MSPFPVPAGDALLRESDHAQVEPRLAALRNALGPDCPSDYTFSNLYLFRSAHTYRLVPGEFPSIAGVAYDGTSHALPLFDVGAVPAHTLSGLIERHGCLFPVAGPAVERLDPRRFHWHAERDDSDYLYRAEDFRLLRGSRLRKKRAQINQLLALHRMERRRLDGGTASDAGAVLSGWMTAKGKASGQADHDACLAAIAQPWRDVHEGWVWYADGLPAGFLVAQQLTEHVLVVRFAKGLDAYPGIFPLMFHELALQTTATWLNFEQDLGLANFRQTKLSYAPASLLPKYRVTLR